MTKIASKFARAQNSPPPGRRQDTRRTACRRPPRPALPMTTSSATTRLRSRKTPPRPTTPTIDEDERDWKRRSSAEAEPNRSNALTGDDDQIDDPIRIYLMQMGEIPLLSRAEEIAAAQADQARPPPLPPHHAGHRLRARTRRSKCSRAIRDGRTRLDRTMEVSVVNIREKKRLIKGPRAEPGDAGPHRGREPPRFRRWRSARAARSKQRRAAWRRLIARRSRAVRLIEELGLRTQRLQPVLEKVKQVLRQMEELHARDSAGAKGRPALADERAALKKELCQLMKITLESPPHAPPPHRPHQRPGRRVRSGQAAALRRQPAAGGLHRQALPQPRPELPGPHPGRQHRADAGGRQVRVGPRLQVLDLRHLVDPPGDHAGHRRPEPHDPRAGPHDRDDEPRPQRASRAAAAEGLRADRRGHRRWPPACPSTRPPACCR